jgi:hypothetical protein
MTTGRAACTTTEAVHDGVFIHNWPSANLLATFNSSHVTRFCVDIMAALTSVVDEHHLHTLVQQRRSSSVFGAVLTNKDVQQGTALEVQGILDDNGTPEQKTTLMHGIFAKYATWEFNANACYISRTKFRRFCYDANIVSPRGLLVGDIEVVFYESLKEESSNGNQVLAKRKEKRVSSRDFNKWKDKKFIEKKGQENRMLSFQQFVSALGMVALKIFGPKRFEHLDPRLCTRVASVDEPFHLFYNKVLLPFAARNGLFAESLQALELSDVEKQTLPEALALIQVEKRAFTEIFSFYSQKDSKFSFLAPSYLVR